MTRRGAVLGHASREGDDTRVGLFGLLGTGNLGNDASFEVVLTYLETRHPSATVDAMCLGPDSISERYGIHAIPLQWYIRNGQPRGYSGLLAIALKILGKVIDTFRVAAWVRRHDIVIIPGMGVLETSLPLKASGTPFSMFLLSLFGRIFRTKVAFVSVGANVINQSLTRWLYVTAARLAYYRSYRDHPSRDALQRQGVDTTHDHVYPDLVFGMQQTPESHNLSDAIGVGVMAYHGGTDDRENSDQIYARYSEAIKGFICWLVDSGHRVRLFWGDNVDRPIVQEILDDLHEKRPNLNEDAIVAEQFSSLRELMREMTTVSAVVGTRYHNVLSALKLSKPTISIGYSTKHDALMATLGLPEFCHSARTIDLEKLIEQFNDLESRSIELAQTLMERNRRMALDVELQFAELSATLFPLDELAMTGTHCE